MKYNGYGDDDECYDDDKYNYHESLDNDIDGDNGRIDYDGHGNHDDKDDDDGYNDDLRMKIKYILTIV